MHAIAARISDIPELELTQDEGVAFMAAAQSVARHYSVQTTQKTLDWVAFMGCCASIYGPRAVVIMNRRKHEAQRGGPAQVFEFTPNTAG